MPDDSKWMRDISGNFPLHISVVSGKDPKYLYNIADVLMQI